MVIIVEFTWSLGTCQMAAGKFLEFAAEENVTEEQIKVLSDNN